MELSRRDFIRTTGAAAVLAASGTPLYAQELPATARIVVGFPPGSTPDVVARKVGDAMSSRYANSVVVENRDGAGGQISVTAITSMAPDGLSVLLTPMSILGVYPHTYSKLPYDAKADLTPVSMGVTFDYAFAVGPTVPD